MKKLSFLLLMAITIPAWAGDIPQDEDIEFRNAAQLIYPIIHTAASAPTAKGDGQLYFDTTTKKIVVRANSAWQTIVGQNDNITSPLGTITTAQIATGNIKNASFDAANIVGAATVGGMFTLAGSAANAILGSNYLSGDGGDEGIAVTSTGNVGINTLSPSPLNGDGNGLFDIVGAGNTELVLHRTAVASQAKASFRLTAGKDLVICVSETAVLDVIKFNSDNGTTEFTPDGTTPLLYIRSASPEICALPGSGMVADFYYINSAAIGENGKMRKKVFDPHDGHILTKEEILSGKYGEKELEWEWDADYFRQELANKEFDTINEKEKKIREFDAGGFARYRGKRKGYIAEMLRPEWQVRDGNNVLVGYDPNRMMKDRLAESEKTIQQLVDKNARIEKALKAAGIKVE